MDKKRGVPEETGEFSDEDFAAIRTVLRERRHFDLGSYKDTCIRRRIARRIRALGIAHPASYLKVLEHNEDELDALMAALTIHVSHFFRNPGTFMALKEGAIPELLRTARQRGRHEVRLWSVGCSSGEEPYSLAILVEELSPDLPVSILGTDLSEEILRKAREGVYDPLRLSEVSQERMSRHFIPEGKSFRLRDAVRSRVQFQRHDILSPSPYPTADLILCRNVLIYFSREDQERTLCRFAASLRGGGRLVLGKAETLLGEARQLLIAENTAERIYRKSRP